MLSKERRDWLVTQAKEPLRGLPAPPRWLIWTLVFAVVLSWLPLLLLARNRVVPNEQPRVHLFQDMDKQPKYEAQSVSPLFADNRAMRPRIPGTVARGELDADALYHRGRNAEGDWAERFPAQVTVDEDFVRRGQRLYQVYCATCHGRDGQGNGPVHLRAQRLTTTTPGTSWVQPSDLTDETRRALPLGRLYNTIATGVRTMPAYGPQIPTRDRWSIVAYVKALQLSQHAKAEQLPETTREKIP